MKLNNKNHFCDIMSLTNCLMSFVDGGRGGGPYRPLPKSAICPSVVVKCFMYIVETADS